METVGPSFGREADREAREQLDGLSRVAALPSAAFLAVSVGSEPGDPVVVFIGWSSALVEQAYPGTAIWRAAVESFLRSPTTDDPANKVVRDAAADSLARFPSLDHWLYWYDHERPARSDRRLARAERRSQRRSFWIGRWF